MKTLSHVALNEFGQWVQSKPESHPIVVVQMSVSSDSYEEFDIPEPARHQPTNVQAVADTGAMVMVAGMNLVHQLGVKRHELIPVSFRIGAADNDPLKLIGGILVNVSLSDRSHKQLCYIAEGVNSLLLSETTLKKLGLIPENFPAVETTNRVKVQKCEIKDESDPDSCSCPERTKPPPVPGSLPFPATEENIPRLKEWIVQHYNSIQLL